jgi:hypothetical protein
MFPRLTIASAELAVLCRLDIDRVAITDTIKAGCFTDIRYKIATVPSWHLIIIPHMHSASSLQLCSYPTMLQHFQNDIQIQVPHWCVWLCVRLRVS